jgi:hypothetical protein
MSNVLVISHKKLEENKQEVLDIFVEFQEAMIEKNSNKLNELIDDNYILTHMSGKQQSKQEYIAEIMDGTLNYYHSTIHEPIISIEDEKYSRLKANVELDAKVYGMKGSWTLKTNIMFEKQSNRWIISKWDA